MRNFRASLFAAFVAMPPHAAADDAVQKEDPAAAFEMPAAEEVVKADGLPPVGKWMIDPNGHLASWLGATYEGKQLQEPINVIIVDRLSTSPEEAKTQLVQAAASAGYPSRKGHSSGYSGFIGDRFYSQLPEEKDHAFSNAPYEFDNNHGRIFGPHSYDDAYVFIGAFSRERIVAFAKLKHQYASFDRARDDFSQSLDRETRYKISGFVDMGNAIVGNAHLTTGDHDGQAVLIERSE